jgi:SAM-dependent methyltransferase
VVKEKMKMKAIVCINGRVIEGILTKEEVRGIILGSRQRHESEHPEGKWLRSHCTGLTADIGCGAEKVVPHALGIDRLQPGETGKSGCMLGIGTIADISADGGNLYFIGDGTFDSVVSRHCFEHLPDPKATLKEWLRILRKGGRLAMVLPNDHWRDFLAMDPDHKFRCYPETVEAALSELNKGHGPVQGMMIENGRMVHPNWSFFSLIERL